MRPGILIVLSALAAPVSADECTDYRNALAVAKATRALVDHNFDMQEHLAKVYGDMKDPAYLAAEAALQAALDVANDAAKFAAGVAQDAANAVIEATEMSALHDLAIAAATHTRHASHSAMGAIIDEAEAARTERPYNRPDIAPAGPGTPYRSDASCARFRCRPSP